MKKLSVFFLALIGLTGCLNAQNSDDYSFANLPSPSKNEQIAIFAGGCFWALHEGMLELKGVSKVISGYSGGTVKNPTYEEVGSKSTGHAESVQVYYDPAVISFASLSEAFFYAHDPTTLNRQGPDVGPDYRSVIFYRTIEEKKIIEAVISKVNASKHYPGPIVTEVVPFKVFYPAEKYHQGYYRLHTDRSYIRNVSMPKVLKLRKAMNAYLKPEFREIKK